MNSNNKINYKSKLLDQLSEFPSGLTITELSNQTKIHRNTVSKYLSILEAEGLVKKKNISAARLYFSEKRRFLRKDLVNSFLQALLIALKNKFSDQEQIFKEVGNEITKFFEFPLGKEYFEEFEKVKDISNTKIHLKLFQKFYNSFDFFQDDLDISIIDLHEDKAIYRLKKSEFLESSDDFIYYFYIVCGITEGVYLQKLNKKVICNVEKINISSNKEESYIDISLEIQN